MPNPDNITIRTPEFSRTVAAQYAAGDNISMLAVVHGCSTTTISRALRQEGVDLRRGARQAPLGTRWNMDGYIVMSVQDDDPILGPMAIRPKHGLPRVLEHRAVMARHLGRPLVKGEEVHHKNSVRHDNRIENLELWVKSQPVGARVEDLVAYAREILERYAA